MTRRIDLSRFYDLLNRFSLSSKLKKNFGHDDELLFRAYTLLGTIFLTTSILAAFSILISSLSDAYIDPAARNIFGPLMSGLTVVQAAALPLLANGRFRLAQAIVAWGAVVSVYSSIALTGGVEDSVAAPTLLIPPTIFFCLYGVRTGLVVALALPLACVLQSLLLHAAGVRPPHFESTANPALNRAFVLATTYLVVILALVIYGRMNALLRAQRKAERLKLQSLANEDTLTGIANARHFRQRLEQACARVDRHGGQLAVLYLDFNNFKQINDEFGHATGDEVLRLVAQRLRQGLRREDTVARLGGDEFAVLVDSVLDDQQIPRLIERIRQIVADPVDIDGLRHTIGASVGQALYPTDVADRRAVVEFADRDMYRAKLENRAKKPSAA